MEDVDNNPSKHSSPQKFLLSREQKPLGRTWEDWTIEWWQWVLSIEKDKNPGIDTTGSKFNPHQPYGNVIFLVGTFEGNAERSYVIPKGKNIFFPIINFITSYTEEPDLKTESQLIARATQDIDSIVNKRLIIDGFDLGDVEKYRIRSPVFDLTFPENNVFDFKPGPTKAISDGYWIFLRPLTFGRHDIYASGSCYYGKTTESILWHLEVKDS